MPSRLALRIAAAAILAIPAFAARPLDTPLGQEAGRLLDARIYQLGLNRDHAFAVKNVFEDETGAHVRMNQFYKGVRVFGGESIVHLRGGRMTEHTDALVRGLSLNASPTLGTSDALASVHQTLAPKGSYAHTPTAELVIATPEGHSRAALVYHVHTELENAVDGIKHTDFFVDAHSGSILES